MLGKDKREKLQQFCNKVDDCENCPIKGKFDCEHSNFNHIETEAELNELLKLFGSEKMGESLESKCLHCRWKDSDGFEEPCIHCKHNGGEVDLFEDVAEATVKHPEHYKTGKIECIEAMIDVYGAEATKDFCLLNAFKYLWRCRNKGKEKEDIKKAIFYLEKYLEL